MHDEVVTAWQADERRQALQKLADAIAAEVNKGKSLDDRRRAARTQAFATPTPLRGTANDPTVPPTLVAKLFDAKQGQAVTRSAATKRHRRAASSSIAAAPTRRKTAEQNSSDARADRAGAPQGDLLSADTNRRCAALPGQRSIATRSTGCSEATAMQTHAGFREVRARPSRAYKPVLVWTTFVADLETPVSAMLKLADGRPN